VKLHELRPAAGSRHPRKRIGRGISAGQGKTSGRGQKGAGARQGSKVPRAFEGGQMKLTMRLPKLRGFSNRWRVDYTVLNLSKLNRFPKASIVDGAALAASGLVGSPGERVKLLAAGRLRVALTVRVHRASEAARRAVEAAGGRVELLEERVARVPNAGRKAKPAGAAEEEPAAAEPEPRARAARVKGGERKTKPAAAAGDEPAAEAEPEA
jgi:large subunit ribosomal protein L15